MILKDSFGPIGDQQKLLKKHFALDPKDYNLYCTTLFHEYANQKTTGYCSLSQFINTKKHQVIDGLIIWKGFLLRAKIHRHLEVVDYDYILTEGSVYDNWLAYTPQYMYAKNIKADQKFILMNTNYKEELKQEYYSVNGANHKLLTQYEIEQTIKERKDNEQECKGVYYTHIIFPYSDLSRAIPSGILQIQVEKDNLKPYSRESLDISKEEESYERLRKEVSKQLIKHYISSYFSVLCLTDDYLHRVDMRKKYNVLKDINLVVDAFYFISAIKDIRDLVYKELLEVSKQLNGRTIRDFFVKYQGEHHIKLLSPGYSHRYSYRQLPDLDLKHYTRIDAVFYSSSFSRIQELINNTKVNFIDLEEFVTQMFYYSEKDKKSILYWLTASSVKQDRSYTETEEAKNQYATLVTGYKEISFNFYQKHLNTDGEKEKAGIEKFHDALDRVDTRNRTNIRRTNYGSGGYYNDAIDTVSLYNSNSFHIEVAKEKRGSIETHLRLLERLFVKENDGGYERYTLSESLQFSLKSIIEAIGLTSGTKLTYKVHSRVMSACLLTSASIENVFKTFGSAISNSGFSLSNPASYQRFLRDWVMISFCLDYNRFMFKEDEKEVVSKHNVKDFLSGSMFVLKSTLQFVFMRMTLVADFSPIGQINYNTNKTTSPNFNFGYKYYGEYSSPTTRMVLRRNGENVVASSSMHIPYDKVAGILKMYQALVNKEMSDEDWRETPRMFENSDTLVGMYKFFGIAKSGYATIGCHSIGFQSIINFMFSGVADEKDVRTFKDILSTGSSTLLGFFTENKFFQLLDQLYNDRYIQISE